MVCLPLFSDALRKTESENQYIIHTGDAERLLKSHPNLPATESPTEFLSVQILFKILLDTIQNIIEKLLCKLCFSNPELLSCQTFILL